jgi:hypothetical protein
MSIKGQPMRAAMSWSPALWIEDVNGNFADTWDPEWVIS